MARFDLTDFEWPVLEPLLPTKVRGVKRVDDRRVLNGIFWQLRTLAGPSISRLFWLVVVVHEPREKCTSDLADRRHERDSVPKNLITPGFPFLTQVFRPMRSRPRFLSTVIVHGLTVCG